MSRQLNPCAITVKTERCPCASCSLRHNNVMWPICLSSLASTVPTAGIVQGTQSGRCVFQPDIVSPLQKAFNSALELFGALKITQCTEMKTPLKAEICSRQVLVLLSGFLPIRSLFHNYEKFHTNVRPCGHERRCRQWANMSKKG